MMSDLRLRAALNDLVSDYLEDGGDPALCADLLREVADTIFGDDPSPSVTIVLTPRTPTPEA